MKKLAVATFVTAALSLSAQAQDYADNMESMSVDEKIPHSFDTLDKDKDGYISREEAKGHEVLDYFAKIDGLAQSTADDKLSEKEFDKFLALHARKTNSDDKVDSMTSTIRSTEMEPPLESFDELDADKNAMISMGEAENSELSRHFAYLDKDKDNHVSKKEYTEYVNDGADDSE
ncbi:hypothetical protein [Alteromonas oceanisediminis]|uniref:hypothetical protein n=1 Tax=Alteromonas oceanisediminis TaxID=2836180 RepID=UPI001BDB3559|nr:hypothetical protein [Alteromonas oceanisediminis]MBT0585252.1 hypothetical protein [Alteromonas oceanisediminis]